MTRLIFAALLTIPMGCAATPTTIADVQLREAPMETVRVSVANVDIPVMITELPAHTSQVTTESPAREHIRKMLLSAKSP